MVKRMGRIATRVTSDPPTSATAHTQGAHRAAQKRIDVLPCLKQPLTTSAFPYVALRPPWKVLKLLLPDANEMESIGDRQRWVSHGFATPYSHHTARQHNFSMIAYACLRNLKELEVKLKPKRYPVVSSSGSKGDGLLDRCRSHHYRRTNPT